MRHHRKIALVVTQLLTLTLLAFGAAAPVEAAAPQRKFPLTIKTALIEGQRYSFTFTIWSAASGGTQTAWSEGPVVLTVNPDKTIHHLLGSKRALPALDYRNQYWIQAQTGRAKYRVNLPATGYAFWSDQVNTVPLDARYVQEGQPDAITETMIASGQVTAAKVSSAGAGAETFLMANGSGGVSWQAVTSAAGGDITGVAAGNGLTDGGATGTVTLNVGPGTGIAVAADSVSVDATWADARFVNEAQGGAVTGSMIADGAVSAADLADNAVSSAKLANAAVTAPKLASMGASTGQVLKFDGSNWAPSADISAGFVLPYNGTATSSTALLGITNLGTGGAMYSQSAGTYGLWGESFSSSGIGLYGVNKTSTGTTYGVKGEVWSPSGYSGYFTGGKVYVNGNMGVGTNTPTYRLTVYDNTFSYLHFLNSTSGTSNSDGFVIGTTPTGSPAWIWNNENSNIHFGTDNQTRMTISGDGSITMAKSLNLNTEGTFGALYVSGNQALWWNGDYFSWGYGGNWNYFADKLFVGPDPVSPGSYFLVVNGDAAKVGGGSWSNWSDARLKDIHGYYTKGLQEISALEPVRFTYKEGNPKKLPSDEEQIGFVAQDVRKIFPEAVTEDKDGYLDFNMHAVNVALVNAVKELKAENDLLKEEIERLRAKDMLVMSRIENLEKLVVVSAQR